MNIRPIQRREFEAARQLLAASGWTGKVADPQRFAACVEASDIALVAEDGGEVIGFLRALTDHVFNGYLSMLAVAPEHRGKGVGTALMHAAMGASPHVTWVLRADRPGVARFYESLGFQASAVAMERRRSAS